MTETRSIGLRRLISGAAGLTVPEARLLVLILGLLLLGLAVRYVRLRTESGGPAPMQERKAP